MAAAQFRMHRFRFKVAEDTWNDETRIKVSVSGAAVAALMWLRCMLRLHATG